MEWILIAALLIFLLGAVSSWIWLARIAFIDGPLWGWSVLLIPFGGFIYGVLAWREAHRPLLINLGFVILSYMAYAMLVSIQPAYDLRTVGQKAVQTAQHWLAEVQKPPAWKNDPEVMGTPEAQTPPAESASTQTGKPDTQPQATTPAPATTPPKAATGENHPQEAAHTETPETSPPTTRREPPPLKTRVVRIGAVKVKDKLAPYRKLSPKERIAHLNELMWQPMVICLRRGGTRKGTLEALEAQTLTLRQHLPTGVFDSIVEKKKIRDVLLPKPRQPLTELRCSR